ncbi:MAG TPA: PKD domain-containing protein [Chitinophagaceae bacterium]|nr:PKD domain-containing protein [Chitinophagaceae bacterium]
MKPLSFPALYTLVFFFSLLFSCTKNNDVYTPTPNKGPFANAGPDQVTILPKDSVLLNGSLSSDPDGVIKKYHWTKVDGPVSYAIAAPDSGTTMVRSLTQGVYKFELSISDDRGAQARDTLRVFVDAAGGTNLPPVANAGEDQIIEFPVNSCILNGSTSYDPDGSITSYLWRIISGPASYSIVSSNAAQTVINNLVRGTYFFELLVIDNGVLYDRDTVQVVIYTAGNCNGSIPRINATLTEVGRLSVARSPYVAAAGNKIVFAGGELSSVVDIFELPAFSRTTVQLSQGRTKMAVASSGTKLFFAGGHNSDEMYDNVDIYDVVTNSWTLAHLSEPKSHVAAAAVGDKVFFAGGLTEGFWNQTGVVDIYDISDNSWTTAELSGARYGINAVTAGNKIYFAGGWDYLSDNAPSKKVDIYDYSTNSWTTASLNLLSGGVSGVVAGDFIYWGGQTWPLAEGKAEIWNINSGAVTYSCLTYARNFPTATVRNNDIVFFTPALWAYNEIPSSQFDIYNKLTGANAIGLLNQPIAVSGLITVNNTIYLGGGKVSATAFTDKVYKLSW